MDHDPLFWMRGGLLRLEGQAATKSTNKKSTRNNPSWPTFFIKLHASTDSAVIYLATITE